MNFWSLIDNNGWGGCEALLEEVNHCEQELWVMCLNLFSLVYARCWGCVCSASLSCQYDCSLLPWLYNAMDSFSGITSPKTRILPLDNFGPSVLSQQNKSKTYLPVYLLQNYFYIFLIKKIISVAKDFPTHTFQKQWVRLILSCVNVERMQEN